VSAQTTVARIGQGPVLAVILGATAVVGFGLGIWVGPATLATPSPSPAATSTIPPSASPSTPPASASASPAAPAGPREIILEFSGTAHDVSPPFEVVPGWQIQWQTDGSSLAIAVTGDQNLGIVVDEPGPASGVTSLAPAGNFRLDVAARGPWSITIIQGEEATASPS
jgi:hypothetical protein